MSIEDIGRLTAADESLDHQITDTFAAVASSDLGWTQKIWAALARKDGGLTISFGLGKYHNRNVMDAFAGISRGTEQWTVRASRRLDTDFQTASVGPIHYEVVEGLKTIRFRLEANQTQPIAFDVLFEAELPPFFEKRNRRRSTTRQMMDTVRYHQAGLLSGWVEIDGERQEIGDDWFGFRDHSWGTRGKGIGMPVPDEPPGQNIGNMRLLWGPSLFKRPDGSKFQFMNYWVAGDNWQYSSAHVNEAGNGPDGVRQTEIRSVNPDVRFDPATRRFLGGTYRFELASGEIKNIEVQPLGPSGFHLRTGAYGEWKGGRHGSWRGEYHEDGEYIADVIAELPNLGQFRDAPVMLKDGDLIGYGIQESIFTGVFPELGLTEESDYPTDL
ncbi:MAG: hypothetical protein P8J20_15010 [Novosphingobium sp.]|nr:hypothetical protein [Novosphingobium sp.]